MLRESLSPKLAVESDSDGARSIGRVRRLAAGAAAGSALTRRDGQSWASAARPEEADGNIVICYN